MVPPIKKISIKSMKLIYNSMDAFEEKPIFIDRLFDTIGRFLQPEG